MTKLSKLISAISESKTLAITSALKKMIASGEDALSFSAGEPDFPTPSYIKHAAIKAIEENFTKYTANEGFPKLIDAIINKFKKDNTLTYSKENIIVSNGAKHSLYNILLSICNPGDEVIIQSPYWVSYPEMITLCRAKTKVIQAGVDKNYKISPEDLKNAITDNTKAFIFNSPSNPSGAVYSKNEIIELAKVLLPHKNIYIVSDEIYEKIIFDSELHFSFAQIEELKDRVIVVNGVSKAYAMTGWRIGYAAGPAPIIKLARNLQSHSTSNSSSISQAAALAALSIDSDEINNMVNEFLKRRNFIIKELNEIPGIKCPTPKGAFYAFFDVSYYFGKKYNELTINDSTSFCKFLLEREKVGLVPGLAFGDDNCVRMSYACSIEQIEEGVKRIRRALEELSNR